MLFLLYIYLDAPDLFRNSLLRHISQNTHMYKVEAGGHNVKYRLAMIWRDVECLFTNANAAAMKAAEGRKKGLMAGCYVVNVRI